MPKISCMTAWMRPGLALFIGGLLCLQVAASPLKQDMRDMKRAFVGAMNSKSIQEFSLYAEQLQAGADAAGKLQFRDDPATYQEGMKTLQRDLSLMNQAIQSNDLRLAKNSLRAINDDRKHYHDQLN